MNTRTILASAGLAVALTVGAGSAAFAADGTPSTSTPAATAPAAGAAKTAKVAERCAKVPTVLERMSTATGRLQERLTKLNAAKATADAAGRTKRSERLAQAITRVQGRIDQVATRTTKVQDWSTAHCAS